MTIIHTTNNIDTTCISIKQNIRMLQICFVKNTLLIRPSFLGIRFDKHGENPDYLFSIMLQSSWISQKSGATLSTLFNHNLSLLSQVMINRILYDFSIEVYKTSDFELVLPAVKHVGLDFGQGTIFCSMFYLS